MGLTDLAYELKTLETVCRDNLRKDPDLAAWKHRLAPMLDKAPSRARELAEAGSP